MSTHSSLDRESFQKLLASAFSVQESGMDAQSLSAILEFQQSIATGEPDVDRAIHLVADSARNVANSTGVAIALRRGDQLAYRAGSGSAASYVGRHGKNDFVAYVDAIGKLDGTRRLLEWKTTSSRYPEQPHGLLALDPQLVCYSWVTGISEVAQVVFVRRRLVEIQYFQTAITDEQRQEFGQLVSFEVRIGRGECP